MNNSCGHNGKIKPAYLIGIISTDPKLSISKLHPYQVIFKDSLQNNITYKILI